MPSSPNVIVFFTDQQRWDSTGLHGNPLDLTPNLDRLARRGTHVANSFTCQPVCGPARSCFQTGLYATQTGCYRNAIALPQHIPTLAKRFKSAGYETGYIGKWHLASGVGPVDEAERGGYQYWLGSNLLEFTSDAYRTTVYDNEGCAVELPGYRVDALTDAAIDFVSRKREQPYFLFFSLLEPHHQNSRDDYPAPDGYAERYTGRWIPSDLAALAGTANQHLGGYWGMVKRIDEALGRLNDALKSLGQDKNTIVLFTSDHACHFRTRNKEFKRSCHESSIRVPTALWGPGFDGGGRIEKLVSLIDLHPTLLDAAGIAVPEDLPGRSIRPLLGGRAAEWPDDVFIQISESQVGRAIRTSRWKYGVDAPGKHPWHAADSDVYEEQYLYDLLADPYELNNLVGIESHAQVASAMRQRLLRRLQEAGEPVATINPAPMTQKGRFPVGHDEASL